MIQEKFKIWAVSSHRTCEDFEYRNFNSCLTKFKNKQELYDIQKISDFLSLKSRNQRFLALKLRRDLRFPRKLGGNLT